MWWNPDPLWCNFYECWHFIDTTLWDDKIFYFWSTRSIWREIEYFNGRRSMWSHTAAKCNTQEILYFASTHVLIGIWYWYLGFPFTGGKWLWASHRMLNDLAYILCKKEQVFAPLASRLSICPTFRYVSGLNSEILRLKHSTQAHWTDRKLMI